MDNRIYFLIAFLIFIFSCNENKLTPSDPQSFYDFPQGNSDYDQKILAFYEKYGTQILYKYKESDFRWSITGYIPYYSIEADENYVRKAFNFIEENWINVWPEEFLDVILPFRILFSSRIYYLTQQWGYDEDGSYIYYDTTNVSSIYGSNHVAFGYVNSILDELSNDEKKIIIGDLNRSFIGFSSANEKIEVPESFKSLYSTTIGGDYEGAWGYNGYGFLEYSNNMSTYLDFGIFVKYLTIMSEEEFKNWALSDDFDLSQDWVQEENSYVRTYLINQKYNIVINYFLNEFGINLHDIGNRISAKYN